MVYFVAANDPYEYPVYPEFLDKPNESNFEGVVYEQDPGTLDLRAVEREFLAKGNTAMEHGYRVVGTEVPKKLLWDGGSKAVPELILKNCIAVSSRFRDLVERFEPGVHQFFPVAIYKERDGAPVADYFWINVCNRIDSVHDNATTYQKKLDYEGRPFWSRVGRNDAKLVFSREKIGPMHLWVDPNIIGPNHFYVSNAFAEAARAEEFLGLSLSEREEA